MLPISRPPVPGGWVTTNQGRIAALGTSEQPPPGGLVDLGQTLVLPALVNAHVHLELSYLRGAVPPAGEFTGWIREVMRRRREYPDPADPAILASARTAIGEAQASGTGLVGDISNTLATVPLMAEAGLPGAVFHELLGFNAANPAALIDEARRRLDALPVYTDIVTALAPHAPYSVSPGMLQAIRHDIDRAGSRRTSVHLAESPAEVSLVARGEGPWRTLLEDLGVWTDAWRPPGTSPVRYLADAGFLDHRVLAVHCVQASSEDAGLLKSLGVTVVSCPRSNQHVGAGRPPLQRLYDAGVNVAFGTDSLASVRDLNLFEELAEARRIAPSIAARRLLSSATLGGARALGFDDDFGSIEPGKRAALLAVTVPAGVDDVEEYLLSGIKPEAIRWLR